MLRCSDSNPNPEGPQTTNLSLRKVVVSSTWNAKCPIFLGNFTPKTSNYCLKNRALGFPGIFNFHPYLGKMNPFWQAYFSIGLKSPTSIISLSSFNHHRIGVNSFLLTALCFCYDQKFMALSRCLTQEVLEEVCEHLEEVPWCLRIFCWAWYVIWWYGSTPLKMPRFFLNPKKQIPFFWWTEPRFIFRLLRNSCKCRRTWCLAGGSCPCFCLMLNGALLPLLLEASSHDICIQTSTLLDLTISCISMWQGQSILWRSAFLANDKRWLFMLLLFVLILSKASDHLGGGFKCFLFSPLPGEMIQFWLIFFKWVETTN